MWGIKLKGFIRQAYLSYSQGYDDNGEEGKENNVKYDMDKDNMNDKDNDENKQFSKCCGQNKRDHSLIPQVLFVFSMTKLEEIYR